MTAKTQQLDWNDLQILLAFGDAKNLQKAAQNLGFDATTLSRRMRALELKLGESLLVHEGRNLRLTAIGQKALQAARVMDDAANRMLLQLSANETNAAGVVSLTALNSILKNLVLPAVPSFAKKYPSIILDLISDPRNLAIGRREADLAIRLARPAGADIVARKLLDIPFVVAGTQNGSWITYDETLSALPEAVWTARNVQAENIVLQANSIELIAEAVRKGLGQAVLPQFLCTDIPHGTKILSREAWLVMHNETRQVPRIRAVADWLVDLMEKLKPQDT